MVRFGLGAKTRRALARALLFVNTRRSRLLVKPRLCTHPSCFDCSLFPGRCPLISRRCVHPHWRSCFDCTSSRDHHYVFPDGRVFSSSGDPIRPPTPPPVARLVSTAKSRAALPRGEARGQSFTVGPPLPDGPTCHHGPGICSLCCPPSPPSSDYAPSNPDTEFGDYPYE